VASIETERLDDGADELLKPVGDDPDSIAMLFEECAIPLDRWSDATLQNAHETLDVPPMSAREFDPEGDAFGHRHLAGGGELSDALYLLESFGSFRVMPQGNARELGKRFDLDQRAIEIEDKMTGG
jgi:hypothetical protein